jgi:hypothetical protein
MAASTSSSSRCVGRAERQARRGALLAGVACLGWAGFVPRARASDKAGHRAPACVERALGQARLSGSAELRWWGLDIYRAWLWVGPSGLDTTRLGAQAFALELRYARSLRGADIADKSAELIARLGLGSPAQRRAWHASMRAMFPDVHAGDTLVGLYRPDARGGARTRFVFDGRSIGDIDGREFAQAFFSIWLSPRTSQPALRQALLAGVEQAR